MYICYSPWLIAACRVLRRLLVPRHSPCALSNLTFRLALAKRHAIPRVGLVLLFSSFIQDTCLKISLKTCFQKLSFRSKPLPNRFDRNLRAPNRLSYLACALYFVSVQDFLFFSLSCLFSMQFSRCSASPCSAVVRAKLVGLNGLEPSTSRLSGVRSNQLSYKPAFQGRALKIE